MTLDGVQAPIYHTTFPVQGRGVTEYCKRNIKEIWKRMHCVFCLAGTACSVKHLGYFNHIFLLSELRCVTKECYQIGFLKVLLLELTRRPI